VRWCVVVGLLSGGLFQVGGGGGGGWCHAKNQQKSINKLDDSYV